MGSTQRRSASRPGRRRDSRPESRSESRPESRSESHLEARSAGRIASRAEAAGHGVVPASDVQRVLDDIPVALLVARTDGSAASVNRAWCRAVGLAPAEALGHGWLGVVGPADRARLLTALRQVAGDGSPADRDAGTSYDGCCVELDVAVGDRRTRWRLARDECGTVVVAVVDAGPALLTTSDGTAGVPDWLIPELFEVGLDLASCASTLPEPARARVAAAMGGIDRVIARLRRSTRAGRRDFS